ncbi:MAG: energy transducer TonB [Gloeotrichia echinulata DVL01]|nr:TonB family protein [Gloeotrichia echinulata DEX184]
MSLSSTALEQREKEAQTLKSFLLYSLIGSTALHIGVFALALSNLLKRIPQLQEDPIDVVIIETPTPQQVKPLEITKSQPKVNAGGGGGGGSKPIQTQTTTSGTAASLLPLTKQSTVQTGSIQKLVDRLKTPASQPTITTVPPKPIENTAPPVTEPSIVQTGSIQKLVDRLKTPPPQPTIATVPSKPIENTAPAVTEPSIVQTGSIQKLVDRLKTPPPQPTIATTPSAVTGLNVSPGAGANSSTPQSSASAQASGSATNNSSSNGVGNGSGNGVGNGSGNGVGNGSGNGVGNEPKKEDTTVATAPKPPTDNGSRLDRADCLKCDIKYPDRARRRGVEGNPEVAVDTDDNGNVTRVRLIRSSGDNELDEAAQRAAQEWKLKPTSGGRQGVKASVNFAIQGSRRHRELQETQRKRQAESTP